MDKLCLLTEPAVSGVVEPEGVSFDGVTDYLSRSSDLVGNVDSKTFTFSCWVYKAEDSSSSNIINFATSVNFFINISQTTLTISGYDQSAGSSLYVRYEGMLNMRNKWNHLVFSFDMASSSTASNFYINDINYSFTKTTWLYNRGLCLSTRNWQFV